MSNLLFIGGGKGGTTKSTTAHLLCLGAILSKQPAAYVLTDPNRDMKPDGRPYSVLDGRDGNNLAQIIMASSNSGNGWLIIDGAGNRPAFDKAVSAQADLTLLPFRDAQEDVDTVLKDLSAMPAAFAWPAAWPTNKLAAQAAQKYLDQVRAAFPLRVVQPPLSFVNSAKSLMDTILGEPSTEVRREARRAFAIMAGWFEDHQQTDQPAALSA